MPRWGPTSDMYCLVDFLVLTERSLGWSIFICAYDHTHLEMAVEVEICATSDLAAAAACKWGVMAERFLIDGACREVSRIGRRAS